MEEIINRKRESGKIFYKIKWKGFSYDDATWEPLDNLTHLMEDIAGFERGIKEAKEGKDVDHLISAPENNSPKKKGNEERQSLNIDHEQKLSSTKPRGRKPKFVPPPPKEDDSD